MTGRRQNVLATARIDPFYCQGGQIQANRPGGGGQRLGGEPTTWEGGAGTTSLTEYLPLSQ